ncbi:MAG: hypothetical protein HRU69_04910 [Flammeovirgaceae bacterium]|nr:MAG: hypothetical protein HRU69_04910 [Flammeovirgaceae bacterium]
MRYFFILIIAVLATSCLEITYKEPQPKGVPALAKVPRKLQGSYYLTEDGIRLDDILVIFENGYRLEPKDKNEKVEEFLLSDSLILKHYKGYYFVNSRATYSWHLRVLQRKKNGDLQLMEMENVPENEEERKQFLERLNAEVPVIKTATNGNPRYVIDPTSKKLTDLIRKGFFKEKILLVKKPE